MGALGSIQRASVYSFAPAIGTAHGLYKSAPHLMPERVTELVATHPIPMVLHGGTGLSEEQFRLRAFSHPQRGLMTIDKAIQLYAWHGPHHTAHITRLREREGW